MNDFFNIDENDFRNILKDNPLNDNSGDPAIKEVGDRVRIWDYSSVTNEKGIELAPWDYDKITDGEYYVVVADKQKNTYDSYFILYSQDLIVAHPKSKKQYRVSSKHVRLL
jgi:hypothetical protein